MAQLTTREARREVYRLAFRVWLVMLVFWAIISALLVPVGFNNEPSAGVGVFIVGGLFLIPLAIANAYKRWVYQDAARIWKYPAKALMQIRSESKTEQSRIEWTDRPDEARAARIFPDYINARNAALLRMETGLIDNGPSTNFIENSGAERPMNWKWMVLVGLAIVLTPLLVVGSCYVLFFQWGKCDVFTKNSYETDSNSFRVYTTHLTK